MNREFSIRVSGELADWVRRQGSPQDVIEMLAVQAARGRLRVLVPDPGPGPERLTVRFPVSGLRKLRVVTSSRQNIAAFRKLLAAGCESAALPVSRPVARLASSAPAVGSQVARRDLPMRVSRSPVDVMAMSPAARFDYFGVTGYRDPLGVALDSDGALPAAMPDVFAMVPYTGKPDAQRGGSQVRELLRFLFWPLVR